MKKDNKERLFEVMKMVNPELILKENYMQEAPINQNDDQIGEHILNALNLGLYTIISKKPYNSNGIIGEKIIVNIGKEIIVSYSNKSGVSIEITNNLGNTGNAYSQKNINQNLAIKIYDKLKTLA
jgi:hypothetical protein